MYDIELSKEEIERILFWLDERIGLDSDDEENTATALLMSKLIKILDD